MNNDLGRFIFLYENFIEKDELWKEKRELSKAEAWIYILFQANHKEKMVIHGAKAHKCKRGQFITSLGELQKAFNWGSKNRVKRYLELLKDLKKISTDPLPNSTRITICSYPKYRPERHANGTTAAHERIPTNNIISNNIYTKNFSTFWEKYGGKGNFETASIQWGLLSNDEKEEIFERLPQYIQNTPEKFRRYAENWIDPTKKHWRDKIEGEKSFHTKEQKKFGQWIHSLMLWIKKQEEPMIKHKNYLILPKPEKNMFSASPVKIKSELYHKIKNMSGYVYNINNNREITPEVKEFLKSI